MASSALAGGRFALGVFLRAGAIGGLALAAFWALGQQFWATALVAAGLAALLAVDLVRSAQAADRMFAQFVDAIAADGLERPRAPPGLARFAAAVERALDRAAASRAALRQRIDFLDALADTVPAALLVADEAGRIVTANRAARLSLGAESGRLSGVAKLPPAVAARLLELGPGAREIVRLADNRAVLVQAASLTLPDRRLRLFAFQDVAGELAPVELKAWQDLVRVLSHELMNSLTPICSLSESLAAGVKDPVQAEAAQVIARRAAGLMDFVERYRRVADVPPPVKERLVVADLFARLEPLVRAMDPAADVAARAPPGLAVRADAALLEQALINLAKNAVEAVRGRPGARVRLLAEAEADHVVLTVADNGPGLIDAEVAFVPFYSTKPGGSGVGLTLARQIALAHGGGLEPVPAEGGGAAFRLRLPA